MSREDRRRGRGKITVRVEKTCSSLETDCRSYMHVLHQLTIRSRPSRAPFCALELRLPVPICVGTRLATLRDVPPFARVRLAIVEPLGRLGVLVSSIISRVSIEYRVTIMYYVLTGCTSWSLYVYQGTRAKFKEHAVPGHHTRVAHTHTRLGPHTDSTGQASGSVEQQ